MSTTPVQKFLNALYQTKGEQARQNGKGWSARCPAHDDRNPSLSVSDAEDGRALVHCHAGCHVDDILAAVNLSATDLFPTPVSTKPHQSREKQGLCQRRQLEPTKTYATANGAIEALEHDRGKSSAQWVYDDGDGNPVGVVARWDSPDGKTIRPVSRNGEGWIIGGMPEPRPLYCLPDLIGVARVYICEGEKAADAARSIGLTATTSAHGSKSPGQSDWTPLAGKEVVILPDNDDAGGKYADAVAEILAKLAPSARVKIVELSELPVGGDIADWIEQRDAHDLDELRATILRLADDSEVIQLAPQAPRNKQFQPFPADALPEPIRGFIVDGAKAIGCSPSYIALPTLACLGRAIGNKRAVRLKRTWSELPIIWAAIIGKSGTQKTPAIQLAVAPLIQKQNEAIERYDRALEEYAQAKAEYDKAMSQWKRSKSDERPPWEPTEPSCQRFIVGDITIEALADRLEEQFDGVIVVRDELAGWVDGIAEYKGGKGSDMGHWLATWSGAPLVVDRKTGAKRIIHVPRAAVNIVGGIQPGILRRAIGREHLQDGLCARLLLAMPDSMPVRWSEATIAPHTEEAMAEVYDRLLGMEPAAGADGNPTPFSLPLSDDAKVEWANYYNRHRAEQAELDDDLAAAWSKLEAYSARFGLVVQLARWATGTASDEAVDADSIRAGIALSDWFAGEARRVYTMLSESDDDRDQRRLIEWTKRKGGSVTAREVRRGHRRYSTSTAAENALNILVEAGYGQWKNTPATAKGGRPSKVFVLSTVDETPTIPVENDGFVDAGSVDACKPQLSGDDLGNP